jgi:hypothetical protein
MKKKKLSEKVIRKSFECFGLPFHYTQYDIEKWKSALTLTKTCTLQTFKELTNSNSHEQ